MCRNTLLSIWRQGHVQIANYFPPYKSCIWQDIHDIYGKKPQLLGPFGCLGIPGQTSVWHWVITPWHSDTVVHLKKKKKERKDNTQGNCVSSIKSHTGNVHLTGMAVEMTCTVDLKQQYSWWFWDRTGKAPVVSPSFLTWSHHNGGVGGQLSWQPNFTWTTALYHRF